MKRKKINRQYLFFIFLGMIVTIVAMSVVYAALSTKLLISGTSDVVGSSFALELEKVTFEEVYGSDYNTICHNVGGTCDSYYLKVGGASISDEPIIDGTTIKDFKISLSVPGDGIAMMFKVSNVGTIPVKLYNVINSDANFVSLNNSVDDVEWAKNNISYFSSFGDMDTNEQFDINDILCPGKDAYLVLGVELSSAATTIPSGGVEISNIGAAYDFVQTDQYLCD